jgi:RNA polymerase sigma-70 factor (ECF subfamily)
VQILKKMPDLERAVLTEFYLNEKPAKQICEELSLTDTQFRLLKWKAKRRLGKLGRRGLRTGPLNALIAQRIN